MIREITKMFNVFLADERVPDEWKKAIIFPFSKSKVVSSTARIAGG